MNQRAATIEALLFASAKPLSLGQLSRMLECEKEEVAAGLEELEAHFAEGGGLALLRNGEQVQIVTRPEFTEDVAKVAKEDVSGELTRPSLETLTILAYRGPMTRPELEQIRGVQSALILRNLMIRGLVEEKGMGSVGRVLYGLTMDCLKALGISRVEELPNYAELRGHSAIQDVLNDLESSGEPSKEALPMEDKENDIYA